MIITISNNALELGAAAARLAGARLNEAIAEKGEARLVLSTGESQFETLDSLLKEKVDWQKVEIFHLDEYLGLPVHHNASFRKYLNDRFIRFIDCRKFHSIENKGDLSTILHNLSAEIQKKPVDVGLIGIGVNTHIAFNDPPADFNTREAYIVVKLDEQCRKQQVGEGWFSSVDEVPPKAISMTVWQIMQCTTIISAVPHPVKAEAVYKTLTSKKSEMIPATILKEHKDFNLFLERFSASKIVNI
jgi:glucosamine-6-phosphate deaminase